MTKSKRGKIEKELNELYNFISADENQGFNFSLSQSYERIEYLEKLLKSINSKK